MATGRFTTPDEVATLVALLDERERNGTPRSLLQLERRAPADHSLDHRDKRLPFGEGRGEPCCRSGSPPPSEAVCEPAPP